MNSKASTSEKALKVLEGARVISTSADRTRAQLVYHHPDGKDHADGKIRFRSITRHVRMHAGEWVGRNPDDAGLAQLDAAEERLAAAEKIYGVLRPLAAMSVKEIAEQLKLLGSEDQEERDKLPGGFARVVNGLPADKRGKPGAVKAALKRQLAEASGALSEARKKAKAIAKRVPRQVIFRTT